MALCSSGRYSRGDFTYLAHHENFCRFRTRSSGLGGLHLLEELVEDIDESVVIRRTEHLRDECRALRHELHSQTERVKDQRVLLCEADTSRKPGQTHPCSNLLLHSEHHRAALRQPIP